MGEYRLVDPLPDLYTGRDPTPEELIQEDFAGDIFNGVIFVAVGMKSRGASMGEIYERFGGQEALERIIGPDNLNDLKKMKEEQ